jgi:hypothetical protein
MRTARSITCWPAGVTRERLRPSQLVEHRAHEDLEAELVLEQLDLLRDPGLRGVQLLGCGRYVEAGLGDRGQVSQLVELHGGGILAKDFRRLSGSFPC